MGKYRNIFISEIISLIEPKLYIYHWKVLYKLRIFYVDRNFKMTTTAGHSFYIRPIGSFYNQVNDTGSWEPLGFFSNVDWWNYFLKICQEPLPQDLSRTTSSRSAKNLSLMSDSSWQTMTKWNSSSTYPWHGGHRRFYRDKFWWRPCQSLPEFFSPTCPKARFRFFFYLFKQILPNFHLSQSSFTCPWLQASGLAQRLSCSIRSLLLLILIFVMLLWFVLFFQVYQ